MLWFLMQGNSTLPEVLLLLLILLFSATIHEISHGAMALALGDPTAKNAGRLTLDPRVHFTKAGIIAMLVLPIGWANPVPVNTRRLKGGKFGTILVAIAGPLSNFIMMFLGVVAIVLMQLYADVASLFSISMITFLATFIWLNVCLMVFNLIPIPPLDGSKILLAFLPYKLQHKIWAIERYGILILFVVVQILSNYGTLSRIYSGITEWAFGVVINLLI